MVFAMINGDRTSDPQEEFDKWSREIRRGALSLAILSIILEGESYGYDIMKRLGDEIYDSLQVEPSTIYPLLRRLENRRILKGEWSSMGGKKKRLYYVTKEGRKILKKMVDSWLILSDQLLSLLKEADLVE